MSIRPLLRLLLVMSCIMSATLAFGVAAVSAAPLSFYAETGSEFIDDEDENDVYAEFNDGYAAGEDLLRLYFSVWNQPDTPSEPETFDKLRITFDPSQLQFTPNHADARARYCDEAFMCTNFGGTSEEPPNPDPVSTLCEETSATAELVTVTCDVPDAVLDDTATPDGSWVIFDLTFLSAAPGFIGEESTLTMHADFLNGTPTLSEEVVTDWYPGPTYMVIDGGYEGVPGNFDDIVSSWRDLDGEAAGADYDYGDTVPYRLRLSVPETYESGGGETVTVTSPAVNPTIRFYTEDGITSLNDGATTVVSGDGDLGCTDSPSGSETFWTCTLDGTIDIGSSVVIELPIDVLDPDGREFDLYDANLVQGNAATSSNWSHVDWLSTVEDSCDLAYYSGPEGGLDYAQDVYASYAEANSGSPIRVELPCEPGTGTNVNSLVGPWDGEAYRGDHLGTFVATTAGASGERAWNWAPDTTPITDAVTDTFAIDLYGSARVLVHVKVRETADLGVELSGPTSLEVAAAGSNATYTAVVTNSGPDAATSATVAFTLPATASFVSSSATGGDSCSTAGAVVTCTIADLAADASRTYSVVAKYTAGSNGLSLPATAVVDVEATLLTDQAIDGGLDNNAADVATNLTAPPTCPAGQTGTPPNCVTPTTDPATCPTGQTGTPPNCVTPKTIVGDTKGGSYAGSDGDDRFTGGSGNETFRAGPGGDVASGGGGDDKLYGSRGEDRFFGGVGNDFLYGGAGDDYLRGGAGDDKVHGNGGVDDVAGGPGNDQVSCGSGPREVAKGDGGNDVVSCLDRAGRDVVNGGAGNADFCIGDMGDVFVGCERILRVAIPRMS